MGRLKMRGIGQSASREICARSTTRQAFDMKGATRPFLERIATASRDDSAGCRAQKKASMGDRTVLGVKVWLGCSVCPAKNNRAEMLKLGLGAINALLVRASFCCLPKLHGLAVM
jgi:hypothetical protein